MHLTLRFLAEAGTQRLVPFSTTGITGVLTHPNPRPALIAVYNHTLTVLSRLPPHSVYRQSTENLTRHRLAIVESVKPEGWEEFQARLKVEKERLGLQNNDTAFELKVIGKQFREVARGVVTQNPVMKEFLQKELDRWEMGPAPEDTPQTVGAALPTPKVYIEDPSGGGEIPDMVRSEALEEEHPTLEVYIQDPAGSGEIPPDIARSVALEGVPLLPEEPPLYAEQVTELEEKLGAGLIEEVIDQGWMELTLVKEMEEAKIWEPLETQPEEGQWVGFERT